ncbi:diacylglycerol O-acyltransferase 1, partial [Massospora cicadina]
FVPLRVPLERRIQTLCVLFYFTLTIQSFTIVSLILWLGLWPLLLVYFIHICFDRRYEEGGQPIMWARRLSVWKKIANYFPMRIIREAELDPNKQYLFAYHPHGIIGNGAVIGFGTEALGFSTLFPGIDLRPLTLGVNFMIPFYREVANVLGICSVSKRSITHLFNRKLSCLIVVGGAEESLYAVPHTANLVLERRMGFIAMAIKNGASLVPVYAFGENEVYDIFVPEPGSAIHRAQRRMKKLFGFTLPLFSGRSVFTYNYGHLPKRHPVSIVGKLSLISVDHRVGSPIHVEKDPNPSREKVSNLHERYLCALKDLYDRNKHRYTVGDIIPDLNFV